MASVLVIKKIDYDQDNVKHNIISYYNIFEIKCNDFQGLRSNEDNNMEYYDNY